MKSNNRAFFKYFAFSLEVILLAVLQSTPKLLPELFGAKPFLLFALALILLQNPYAAGSASLQLSFASLAGIELFSDRIRNAVLASLPKKLHWRLRNYLSSNVANSLGVLVFTTPLVVVRRRKAVFLRTVSSSGAPIMA